MSVLQGSALGSENAGLSVGHAAPWSGRRLRDGGSFDNMQSLGQRHPGDVGGSETPGGAVQGRSRGRVRQEKSTCYFGGYKVDAAGATLADATGAMKDRVGTMAVEQQLEPAEVVCDFKSALIDALQKQFPNAIIIGCLFHLKQALRRAMKRFLIPEDECSIAMTRGVLDTLTVLEHSLIESVIKWVKREICQRCGEAGIEYSKTKWRGFWDYFQRTWLELYDMSEWNVAGLSNEFVARANNPLERFNRELNDRFPKPRPSMTTFVGVIKTISAEYVRRLADIPRGRVRHPVRERIQLPVPVDIPADIADDSDDDEPTAVEMISDGSSDEEGQADDEKEEQQLL
ncbi:unnamed protein product [Phytophthora fragariaefolia]|uniref:Unnamed protein product n=1 Tax=Phytophthora fragariaefolia TaxID=1490495 RepID=A0A9W6X847_9STRA|nr:unnamed protein product [Phytophthora fragariaefolia]